MFKWCDWQVFPLLQPRVAKRLFIQLLQQCHAPSVFAALKEGVTHACQGGAAIPLARNMYVSAASCAVIRAVADVLSAARIDLDLPVVRPLPATSLPEVLLSAGRDTHVSVSGST